jgi:hypothetical protein
LDSASSALTSFSRLTIRSLVAACLLWLAILHLLS